MEQYIQKGKTEMLMEQEQLKRECINYFKQHTIWKKVFNGFRNKYRSYGKFSGTVVLKNLSAEDIEELEGFFGMNFHGKKSVSVSADRFCKALSHSKYGSVTPEEILMDFFGEKLLGIAQEKERKERILNEIRCEYRKAFENTPAGSCLLWIEELVRMPGAESDLTEWKRQLWLSADICNSLPYRQSRKVYLAVYAAERTGNPHAFDHGTRDGHLLEQIIEKDLELRNRKVELSEAFPAYKRQKSYLLAGLLIDDVSNYALLSGVHAVKKDGVYHRGMEGFCAEQNMVQVSLAVLSEWERMECDHNEIWIVENPSIFARLCGEHPCMCMNGQPRLAGLLVLDLLAEAGTVIHYAGDLDPEGLLIAQKLSQYYKGAFYYWHMTEEDYHMCRSEEALSERRIGMLQKITDPQLLPVARAIAEYGMAGYQEKIDY